MFDQLASLDTSRTTWRIKVRVTRMWPSMSSASNGKEGGLKGFNLILLDDDNTHVQAFVYADNWNKISNKIVEGKIHIISNFYTREATGSLRPTSSKVIINFSNSTTVTLLEDDDFMIPVNKFEFTDLSELFSTASGYENIDSPPFSTDIIGVVENFKKAEPIQTMFGERTIVRFRITDGRYSHQVSVWGQLGVTATELYEKVTEWPCIAVVTSTKLKIFKSSVQISTLPSSKIYLNLKTDYVDAMRTRVEEEGYKAPEKIEESPVEYTPPTVETITLQQLGEKTQAADKEMNFKCVAKITSVEETGNWWYQSCPDCEFEVEKLDGRMKCSNCPKFIPVPEKRYKLVVLAGDSTEAFNFVLADKAVKRIVGQTATKLIWDNQNGSSSGYPGKIKEIAGKELTFNVKISDDNVTLKSKIFQVTDAYDSSYATSLSSPLQGKKTGLNVSNVSANTIDLSNVGDYGTTPGSATSVTKKIKTEK